MKYLGSKRQIAKEIASIVLNDFNVSASTWYIEPFAGGMNMISYVNSIYPLKVVANDNNKYLIEMWKKLTQEGWIPGYYSREEYNHIKNNKDQYPDYVVGWVGFNCSYSGKWFGGFAGETKTKVGTVRNYQQEAIKNVLDQVDKMTTVLLTNLNYDEIVFPKNCIVYCDPPYKNTTIGYKDKSFDSDKFWQWVRDCSNKNNNNGFFRIYVSEYSAPEDFDCVWEGEVKSSLSANGKGGNSKLSIERLFTPKL